MNEIDALQLIFFVIFLMYCLSINVKSFSMSSYKSSPWLFFLFMLVVAIPFLAGETGRLFYGTGGYHIAGGFALLAGASFHHKESTVKPIHYIASGLTIGFGFYGAWAWEALVVFGAMIVLPAIMDRARFLLWLEVAAFLSIYHTKHFPWN